MEQRQRRVHRLARLHAGLLEDQQQRAGVVPGGDHALGRPGGPRRVHHPDAAGRLGELDLGLAVGAAHQPVEVPVDAVGRAARRSRRCGAARAAPSCTAEKASPQVVLDDHGDSVGVGEDVLEGGPALRDVDRNGEGADELDAEVGPEELGAVGHQDRHPLAGPDTELEQPVGRPLNVGQDVAPGDLARPSTSARCRPDGRRPAGE